jgi:hypothetical protein
MSHQIQLCVVPGRGQRAKLVGESLRWSLLLQWKGPPSFGVLEPFFSSGGGALGPDKLVLYNLNYTQHLLFLREGLAV